MRESDVAKSCVAFLKYKGCIVQRILAGLYYTRVGTPVTCAVNGHPDYIVAFWKDGYPIFGYMETKASEKNRNLNNDQIAFLRALPKRIPWIVVDDKEDIEKWINDPFNYHGKYGKIKHVIDSTLKFIPEFTGKSKRKKAPMSMDIILQHEKFLGNVNKQEEPLDSPPF